MPFVAGYSATALERGSTGRQHVVEAFQQQNLTPHVEIEATNTRTGNDWYHAFLLDPKVRLDLQRRGIATALVRLVTRHVEAAGCEWLHVDFRDELAPFYFGACGFSPTAAGLLRLRS